MALFFVLLLVTPLLATDPAENLTETDEAEFRQGGIAQQLMAPGYPAGLYGGAGNAYQQYAAGTGNAGYMNMLRNLYRPPSMGLTDKVKHWVKSFMNRRQMVKPYYGTSGLQYSPDEFGSSGKPVLMNGYKAISVPLRQLQKYYKPYYGGEGTAAQFLQQSQQPGSPSGAAASSSILSYSSPGGGGANAGLYASETANAGHFSGGNAGLFGAGGPTSGLFSSGSSSGGLFSTGGSSGGLFSPGSDASSTLFAASNGGSSAGSLFAGSPGGIYGSSGSSNGGYFQSGADEAASALFGAGGLTGAYSAAAGNSGGLYHSSNSGSSPGGSSMYSLDGGSSSGGLFGSEVGSPYYGGSSSGIGNSGAGYGSRTAASSSSLLASLGGGAGASQYGDLYASGASPAASVYNPNSGDHQSNRGYSSSNKKQQQPSYGASNSALYVSSSSDSMRSPDSYSMKSGQEGQINSFNVDSSRGSPPETSYSVSFQPAQGKSYSASYENAGFQPVPFASEDGQKGKSS